MYTVCYKLLLLLLLSFVIEILYFPLLYLHFNFINIAKWSHSQYRWQMIQAIKRNTHKLMFISLFCVDSFFFFFTFIILHLKWILLMIWLSTVPHSLTLQVWNWWQIHAFVQSTTKLFCLTSEFKLICTIWKKFYV